MIKKTLIEKIILGVVGVATATVLAVLPISSYSDYKDYLAEVETKNEEISNKNKKPVLNSISATLKEGVAYYANDVAFAKAEDVNVVASYTSPEGENYTEVIELGKYQVSTAADFYQKGGDITVTYRNKTAKINVSLLPVVLESIEVAVNPYSVKYAVGSTFSTDGMVVNAVYNDGTVKPLTSEDYTVDKTAALTASDNSVAISYTEGEITKTANIEIGVSQTLNNGAVTSIMIVNDQAIVNAGDVLGNAQMEVNAVYENGNRKPLTSSEYTVANANTAVAFGKQYKMEIAYGEDATKTDVAEVTVRNTIQGEDGVIVGGAVKEETEYKVINGVITEQTNKVKFAGNFSKTVTNGGEGSLTLTFNSETNAVGDITMRCGNSYNCYANGTNANDGYMMKPLQINTILDLTVNGREVQIPTTVILKGCGPAEKYAPLYGIYYEFTFENVQFDVGVNNVKFNFKRSTIGDANCWGESPSTMNIDYVHFDTVGREIPENYTISAIEVATSVLNMEYGQPLSEVEVPIVGTLNNGTQVVIDSSLCNISISGGTGKDYVEFGEYTITADLKSDNALRTSGSYKVKEYQEIAVLTADVVIENGRVYYVFTGSSIGYTADQFELFDGNTVLPLEVTLGVKTFEMKTDITDMAKGTVFYPHLRLIIDAENGLKLNYENGANANGDIRDKGLTFTDGKSVTLNGKTYKLTSQYSMPRLNVD